MPTKAELTKQIAELSELAKENLDYGTEQAQWRINLQNKLKEAKETETDLHSKIIALHKKVAKLKRVNAQFLVLINILQEQTDA